MVTYEAVAASTLLALPKDRELDFWPSVSLKYFS